jgi:hypothetical protein
VNWKIGEAKQHSSEVVRAAEDEPTLADAFAELRDVLRDEPDGVTVPEREDRENVFTEVPNRLPG